MSAPLPQILRMERHAERVATLGPRVIFELLVEIGCAHACLEDVAGRLEAYSHLRPDVLREVGGDRMVPRRPNSEDLTCPDSREHVA
jgi:hypothetical protein